MKKEYNVFVASEPKNNEVYAELVKAETEYEISEVLDANTDAVIVQGSLQAEQVLAAEKIADENRIPVFYDILDMIAYLETGMNDKEESAIEE